MTETMSAGVPPGQIAQRGAPHDLVDRWMAQTARGPAAVARVPISALLLEVPQDLAPVLGELFLGSTDCAASRHLCMSPRTYSRRVAELLQYLSVDTRFQCGFVLGTRVQLPYGPARTFAEPRALDPVPPRFADHIG